MAVEDIIKRIEKEVEQAKVVEIPKLEENPFERLACILDDESNEFRENFLQLSKMDVSKLRVEMIEKIKLEDFNLVRKKSVTPFDVKPLYIPSLDNIGIIKKVYDVLKPSPQILYYCNNHDDILNAVIMQMFGYADRYMPLLAKYTIESIAKYCAIKSMHDSLESSLNKVKPED